MNEAEFEYDVGLSFAGEQREYVEEVARHLKSRGIPVFYDDYERESLWGKDLYAHLSEIYQHMCRYCVVFVSADYADKVWTNLERQNAQARAFKEKQEYILPARFDDTKIPGLADTVGYIDLNQTSPSQLCDLVVGKLGKRERSNYLPPTLDRMYERFGIEDDQDSQSEVEAHARSFFDVLRRMSSEEREAVISLVRFGCPSEMPDNLHINTDLLRRYTGKSVARLKRVLGGVRSLGFRCSMSKALEHEVEVPGARLGHADLFYLTWANLHVDAPEFPEMEVVSAVIEGATDGLCDECGTRFLERLDFSQLASATASDESHKSEG